MGMNIEIDVKDYTDKYLNRMKSKINVFLDESKSLVASQASVNSPVDTGALSRSFLTDSFVDSSEQVAYIGSSLDYAIYQEYGTGEYALNGNGRKGGWAYRGKDGKRHFTFGSHPHRMLYNAVNSCRSSIQSRFKQIME